jgi:hypothetical protein
MATRGRKRGETMQINTKRGALMPGFIVGVGFLLSVALVALGAEPPTTLTVKIPAYQIVKYGEFSQIELPGGQLLVTEEGRPEIFYYMHTQDYPKGYRIQTVTLKSRSPEQKQTGVKLPPVILDTAQKASLPITPGRYPEKDFDWNVVAGPAGGSMLAIAVYPFVYDPGTSELAITTSYEFDVRSSRPRSPSPASAWTRPRMTRAQRSGRRCALRTAGRPSRSASRPQ